MLFALFCYCKAIIRGWGFELAEQDIFRDQFDVIGENVLAAPLVLNGLYMDVGHEVWELLIFPSSNSMIGSPFFYIRKT